MADALQASNVNLRAGDFEQQDDEIVVDAGHLRPRRPGLGDLVIHIAGDRPVYLKDVAKVIDGPAEVDSYSWIGFGPAAKNPLARRPKRRCRPCTARSAVGTATGEFYPAVAYRRGQAEGEQRRLGGRRRRATAWSELAKTLPARRRPLPHHPRLRRDGQREGQRPGREPGRSPC